MNLLRIAVAGALAVLAAGCATEATPPAPRAISVPQQAAQGTTPPTSTTTTPPPEPTALTSQVRTARSSKSPTPRTRSSSTTRTRASGDSQTDRLIEQCVRNGLKRTSCERNIRTGKGGDPKCSDYRVLPDFCKTSTPDMSEIEKKEREFAEECRRKGGELAASALKCMYRDPSAPGGWDDKPPSK